MSVPHNEVELRQVQPGVYLDPRGKVHVDAAELLIWAGFTPTPNRMLAVEEFCRGVAAARGQLKFLEVHLNGR